MKTLKTVNGETLMNTFIPPVEFVVKDLIAQGAHLLSGSPKTGKSWLALMLCLKVATGEKLWNFETKQGTALYLCLEDSIARIQSRLFELTDDAPPDIHFATVAIDTFQKIRAVSNENAYASDYHDVCFLKSIADKLKIAIVLVHHLRKQKDDDPMNRVSGTTGITGAADSTFVLEKLKREGTRAKFTCTGRDIDDRIMELNFDRKSKIWDLITDSVEIPEILLEDITATVVKFMKDEKCFSGTPAELAERLSAYTTEEISPIVLSKRLNQNIPEPEEFGIKYKSKRSNGKRLIYLNSADSDGNLDIPITVPTDPVSEENVLRDDTEGEF